MTRLFRGSVSLVPAALLVCLASLAASAQITVTSATPNNATQGTTNVDIIVKGNGGTFTWYRHRSG